jgi:hypothetical protein
MGRRRRRRRRRCRELLDLGRCAAAGGGTGVGAAPLQPALVQHLCSRRSAPAANPHARRPRARAYPPAPTCVAVVQARQHHGPAGRLGPAAALLLALLRQVDKEGLLFAAAPLCPLVEALRGRGAARGSSGSALATVQGGPPTGGRCGPGCGAAAAATAPAGPLSPWRRGRRRAGWLVGGRRAGRTPRTPPRSACGPAGG